MADNVQITSGTGTTIAADDVGGALHQRVKLCLGADGTAVDAVAGAGAVSSAVQRVTLASDDPAVTALVTDGVLLKAGEAHVGEINGAGNVLDVTLSLDTNIYADGDLLADTQEIANAVRVAAGRAILQSVVVLDEDDQGVGFDLVFLSAGTSLGTENSAPNIADAGARDIIGVVSITSADYSDIGASRIATCASIGLILKAAAASTSLYVAAIIRGGTPTYSASGIRLKLGMLWD
jgi:hypothetical protein